MRANSEFEIEQFIWDKIQDKYNDLSKRGLNLYGQSFYRQLKLPGCGVPDLVGFSCSRENDIFYIDVHIYELKKGRIDGNCLVQLLKYMSFFKTNQDVIQDVHDRNFEFMVHGYLIGNDFDRPTLSVNSIGDLNIEFIRYYIGIEHGISFQTVSDDYFDSTLERFLPTSFIEWIDKTPDRLQLDSETEKQPSQSSDASF